MSEYVVEGKSREELRELACIFREIFGLKEILYFPVVEMLDILGEIFEDFTYEIVEDDTFPTNIHADTDVRTGTVRIKQSVYEGACSGEGRDRMTIAHEIGHYFMLCRCGFRLERNFTNKKVPPFCDPEWQAKCFAGELLVPAHLVWDMSAEEIVTECGVSYDAALVQYDHVHKF